MIRAGTLCIVSTVDHKCGEKYLGQIGEYVPLQNPHRAGYYCSRCGMRNLIRAGESVVIWPANKFCGMLPARWLKPLPPLDEPVESERINEREAVA